MVGVKPEDLAGSATDVAVAGAVEAVATDLVLVVEAARDGVHVGLCRHRLVERGVEDHHLRSLRQDLRDSGDTLEIGRVVQRSEGDALLDPLYHLRGDETALREDGATMQHAVSDSADLVEAGDAVVLRIGQLLEDQLDSLGVVAEVLLDGIGLAVRGLDLEERLFVADALRIPLDHHLLRLGVDELKLGRRAAAIED